MVGKLESWPFVSKIIFFIVGVIHVVRHEINIVHNDDTKIHTLCLLKVCLFYYFFLCGNTEHGTWNRQNIHIEWHLKDLGFIMRCEWFVYDNFWRNYSLLKMKTNFFTFLSSKSHNLVISSGRKIKYVSICFLSLLAFTTYSYYFLYIRHSQKLDETYSVGFQYV